MSGGPGRGVGVAATAIAALGMGAEGAEGPPQETRRLTPSAEVSHRPKEKGLRTKVGPVYLIPAPAVGAALGSTGEAGLAPTVFVEFAQRGDFENRRGEACPAHRTPSRHVL